MKFKNALVSVSDKTGLVEFLRPLVAHGLRVVSTGGTAKYLEENGIPVTQVSVQTGFPEVMDGRVRTLHPRIHMALLARSYDAEDMQLLKDEKLEPFDLVIGNLYPFKKQLLNDLPLEEMVEYIDIGGPALLRASAKSFERITVICDPADYQWVLQKFNQGEVSLQDRKKLAAKVYSHVSDYDATVARYLMSSESNATEPVLKETFGLEGKLVEHLRYGENPQQPAAWYRRTDAHGGLHDSLILQGKTLSYNNLLDLEAACECVRDFDLPAVCAVKHNNPCGVAINANELFAIGNALKADPMSVFGGIVACNFELQAQHAELLNGVFLECVIAPKISSDAKSIFAKKKNLRVLEWTGLKGRFTAYEVKTISGGFLAQQVDRVQPWNDSWKVIGHQPDSNVKSDLMLAWNVVRHLKSNAIAIANEGSTVGLGMGQVNRVESVAHAIERMKHHHHHAKRPVLASDAFFPFPDSIEKIANAGIKWVIQPGGSVKDQEVIETATRLGVNLILTGIRHFRH
jgi:phosphoribosylaminoimidazolecarboxamide formyltransferase/IMP cyclohydrolase